MNSTVLYFAALALHFGLLFVVTRNHLFPKNPVFALWLLVGVGANVALIVLAWAEDREAFSAARRGFDFLWYALAIGSLLWAAAHWNDLANRAIARGVVALVILTFIGRSTLGMPFAGGMGARVADALNFAYLAPTAYLILALGGVRLDRLPLIVSKLEIGNWKLAFSWTRSLLG